MPEQENPINSPLETSPLISDEMAQQFLFLAKNYVDITAENKKITEESLTIINKDKLDTVRQLDREQNIFRFVVLVMCTIALVYLAMEDKLLGVGPILGVIIGGVLNSNSVTNFLSSFRRELPHEE